MPMVCGTSSILGKVYINSARSALIPELILESNILLFGNAKTIYLLRVYVMSVTTPIYTMLKPKKKAIQENFITYGGMRIHDVKPCCTAKTCKQKEVPMIDTVTPAEFKQVLPEFRL
jgi:hypothetical protein